MIKRLSNIHFYHVVLENVMLLRLQLQCMLSKFYYQLMHKRIVFKGVLKFTLKLQYLQHVSV